MEGVFRFHKTNVRFIFYFFPHAITLRFMPLWTCERSIPGKWLRLSLPSTASTFIVAASSHNFIPRYIFFFPLHAPRVQNNGSFPRYDSSAHQFQNLPSSFKLGVLIPPQIIIFPSNHHIFGTHAGCTLLGTFKRCPLITLQPCFRVGVAGLLTSQGMTANITSRNMALKRCIPVEMIASRQAALPAALSLSLFLSQPAASSSLHWGGFFGYTGIPVTLCRRCATSLITRTHGSNLRLGNATSSVALAGA